MTQNPKRHLRGSVLVQYKRMEKLGYKRLVIHVKSTPSWRALVTQNNPVVSESVNSAKWAEKIASNGGINTPFLIRRRLKQIYKEKARLSRISRNKQDKSRLSNSARNKQKVNFILDRANRIKRNPRLRWLDMLRIDESWADQICLNRY